MSTTLPVGINQWSYQERNPTELNFAQVKQSLWEDQQPEALIYNQNAFNSNVRTPAPPLFYNSALGIYDQRLQVTHEDGVCIHKVTHDTEGPDQKNMFYDIGIAVPSFMMTVDILEYSSTSLDWEKDTTNGFQQVHIGIGIPSHTITAEYTFSPYLQSLSGDSSTLNLARQTIAADGTVSLVQSSPTTTFSTGLRPPFTLGFSCVRNAFAVWYKRPTDSTFQFAQTMQVGPFWVNFVDKTVLQTWRPLYGCMLQHDTFSVKSTNLKLGRFGAFNGGRDCRNMTTEYGFAKVDDDGNTYMTATLPHPLGSAQQAVIKLNLATLSHQIIGLIFVDRDGGFYNDLAGQIIEIDLGYKITCATWGDGFNNRLAVLWGDFPASGLNVGAVTILSSMGVVPLTKNPNQQYDGFIIRRPEAWYCAYTTTDDLSFSGNPFYPCLDRCPHDQFPFGTWEARGFEPSIQRLEGTAIWPTREADIWYILTGGGFSWYVLARFADPTIGIFHTTPATIPMLAGPGGVNGAAAAGGTQVTQPWPNMVHWKENVYAITFDGDPSITFEWGKLIWFRSPRYLPNQSVQAYNQLL